VQVAGACALWVAELLSDAVGYCTSFAQLTLTNSSPREHLPESRSLACSIAASSASYWGWVQLVFLKIHGVQVLANAAMLGLYIFLPQAGDQRIKTSWEFGRPLECIHSQSFSAPFTYTVKLENSDSRGRGILSGGGGCPLRYQTPRESPKASPKPEASVYGYKPK
jgi:hypothetical protein